MTANRSRMGLGCLELTELNSSIIDEAIKKGITYFDTADCYGNNASEISLGKKLKDYDRSKLTICTKGGVEFKSDGIHVNASPQYIAYACDASLKRLQTNYIDLYYLHRVDPKTPFEESIRALKNLVDTGKVKQIGLSEVTADQIQRAHQIHPIRAVQIEYSPWSRQDESNDVIKTCQELKIDIVAYSPLGRAFFTARPSSYFESMASTDFRRMLPRYTGENLKKNVVAKKNLQEYAIKKGYTLAQLILAWEIAKDYIPIPTITNSKHLEENIFSLSISLSAAEVQEIDALIDHCQFGGPRYPNEKISAIYPEKKKPKYNIPWKSIAFCAAGVVALGLFAKAVISRKSVLSDIPTSQLINKR